MYLKTPPIHKGHLVGETSSRGDLLVLRRPPWSHFHLLKRSSTVWNFQLRTVGWVWKKIRNYLNNKCSAKQAHLYLLPGLSKVTIQQGDGNSIKTLKPRGQPKLMRKFPKVVIPNSLWTAGCCVRGTRVFGSFAVICNNVSYEEKTLRDVPSDRRPTGKHNW